jgi:superfamily II DNA or RNA helicase
MKYKLRPYQQTIFDNIREAFRTNRAVLAEAPTGAGKSVILADIVDSFLKFNRKWNTDRHLYFLVDEIFLLDQFSDHLAVTNISHDIIGAGYKEGRDVQIHVCTVQTLSKHPPKREPAFFVADEAHITTAPRYMDLFEAHPTTKILGVSASCEQTNGKGLSRESGNGIYDVMLKSPVTMWDLTDGVEEDNGLGGTDKIRHLSLIRYFSIPLKGVEDLHIAGGDFKDKEIEKLLKDRGTFGNAITEMQKFPEIQDYILFFCRNVSACYEMETILHSHGYTAEVLEGTLTPKQRRKVMKNFNTKKTQVLITCKMVQKGVDIVDLRMGVDIQPTPSRSLQRQKTGRFTRMAEGKDYAVYLDLVGNFRCFPEYNIYYDIEWNFHSTKFNKKPVGTGEEHVCPLCYALIPIGKVQCEECGADKLKPKKKVKMIKNMDGELVELTAPVPLKDRSEEDKTAVNKTISKAIVDNDIEALKEIGRTLTTKRNLPFWIYYKLRQNTNIIDVTLLFRIQRSMDFKSSWTHFAKKQIKCS